MFPITNIRIIHSLQTIIPSFTEWNAGLIDSYVLSFFQTEAHFRGFDDLTYVGNQFSGQNSTDGTFLKLSRVISSY